MNDAEFIKKLVSVTPSPRQLEWQKLEYYNFIHFGMNTFTGKEWGDGTTPAETFNPTKLSTDQWASVLKASGSKGIILTAKHHDGFCLWDTKLTDYNVMHSPYGRDIVAELSASCKKYDIKFGLYLSPWDRHETRYGTDEYNDFYVAQLTELATNYGDVFAFWFDGACGEGANGKKQVYDWARYFEVVRKLQPNAVTCICGEDVRWIGNEAGGSRQSEWSVVAKGSNAEAKDLGSRETLSDAGELVWYPAEMDVSLTKRWFWHLSDEIFTVKTTEMLLNLYYASVGSNAALLLNVPVNRKGLIPVGMAKRLADFGKRVKAEFASPVAVKEERDEETYTLTFEPARASAVILREDITKSQRIEAFTISATVNGEEINLFEGTVVGYKKICRFTPVFTNTIKVTITAVREKSEMLPIQLFN